MPRGDGAKTPRMFFALKSVHEVQEDSGVLEFRWLDQRTSMNDTFYAGTADAGEVGCFWHPADGGPPVFETQTWVFKDGQIARSGFDEHEVCAFADLESAMEFVRG